MAFVEVKVRAAQSSRLGRISATRRLIETIRPAAMVRAVRAHCRAIGETPETPHSVEGTLFRIRTESDGAATAMWLENERSAARE